MNEERRIIIASDSGIKLRVAIVLPDPEAYGERFSELAYEHTSHGMIRFVRSKHEAKAWLET